MRSNQNFLFNLLPLSFLENISLIITHIRDAQSGYRERHFIPSEAFKSIDVKVELEVCLKGRDRQCMVVKLSMQYRRNFCDI